MKKLTTIVLASVFGMYSLGMQAQNKIRDFINETAEHIDMTMPPVQIKNFGNRWHHTEYEGSTKTTYYLDDLLDPHYPDPQAIPDQTKGYFARSKDKDGRTVKLRQEPIIDKDGKTVGYKLVSDTISAPHSWDKNTCDGAEVYTETKDGKGRIVRYTETMADAFEGHYYEAEYSVVYNPTPGYESEIESIRCKTYLEEIISDNINGGEKTVESHKDRTVRFIRGKHGKLETIEISTDICMMSGAAYNKKLERSRSMEGLFVMIENELYSDRHPEEYYFTFMAHIKKIDPGFYKLVNDISCSSFTETKQ